MKIRFSIATLMMMAVFSIIDLCSDRTERSRVRGKEYNQIIKISNMKKTIVIALVSALFAGIYPAEAQVRFGVKGGINLTNLSFEKDNYYNIGNKAGFHIGPTLMYSLPIKGLGLDAAVMYDQRSGSAEAGEIIGGRIYPTTIKSQ